MNVRTLLHTIRLDIQTLHMLTRFILLSYFRIGTVNTTFPTWSFPISRYKQKQSVTFLSLSSLMITHTIKSLIYNPINNWTFLLVSLLYPALCKLRFIKLSTIDFYYCKRLVGAEIISRINWKSAPCIDARRLLFTNRFAILSRRIGNLCVGFSRYIFRTNITAWSSWGKL